MVTAFTWFQFKVETIFIDRRKNVLKIFHVMNWTKRKKVASKF